MGAGAADRADALRRLRQGELRYARPGEWDRSSSTCRSPETARPRPRSAGRLDFTSIPTDAIDRFKANPKFRFVSRPRLNYTWMSMNVKDPRSATQRAPGDPPGHRRAVDHHRRGRREVRPAERDHPEVDGHRLLAGAPRYDRDVDKAKQYLAAASPAAAEAAKELTLTIVDAEQDRTVAQVMPANLADLGIEVDPGAGRRDLQRDSGRRRRRAAPSVRVHGLHDAARSVLVDGLVRVRAGQAVELRRGAARSTRGQTTRP